ncbi:hypothetical protein [Candidatus Berkiella aquae]|uniref:Uncharacterized protein n=1 Tax=Candidatus Berkiella aquae TaxID=295108 RepID=A0A0Q9YK38_9GAMM|nr:hypothetical protein [Candidatus Berkiella aquae]MCS5710291.1 hypothetical protein [Candidatus Berkiella aquae]
MSLDWFSKAKELWNSIPMLTGAQARCGDFVYNLSSGRYSINGLPNFIASLASAGGQNTSSSIGSVIDSLKPYLSETALSDAGCAIESKTGLPAPIVCGGVIAGAYAGTKLTQYAYRLFNVKNPVELLERLVTQNITKLLNVDYHQLALSFDHVLDSKADAMLNNLQRKFGSALDKMSPQDIKEYKEIVKKEALDALPKQLQEKQEAITAAIAQSQTPSRVTGAKNIAGMQEASGMNVAFDLAAALSQILYGQNFVATAKPSIKATL